VSYYHENNYTFLPDIFNDDKYLSRPMPSYNANYRVIPPDELEDEVTFNGDRAHGQYTSEQIKRGRPELAAEEDWHRRRRAEEMEIVKERRRLRKLEVDAQRKQREGDKSVCPKCFHSGMLHPIVMGKQLPLNCYFCGWEDDASHSWEDRV
jgi:hypothetical protein